MGILIMVDHARDRRPRCTVCSGAADRSQSRARIMAQHYARRIEVRRFSSRRAGSRWRRSGRRKRRGDGAARPVAAAARRRRFNCWRDSLSPTKAKFWVGERRALAVAAGVVPPEQRNMSLIFQSYAVWPHKTVFENVAYGLARPARLRAARSRARRARARNRSDGVILRSAIRPSSRADSSSASRSRARSSSSRISYCSTSRSRISTRICASRCASRSAACTTKPASRWSTSRTTRPRRW